MLNCQKLDRSITFGMSAWYTDIEDIIIQKEEWAAQATIISQFDDYLRKLELKALRHTLKNGVQPSVAGKTVEDVYFTESGDRRTVTTRLYKQNVAWINAFIQKELVKQKIYMSPRQIRAALDTVTIAYRAAEIRGCAVTVQLSVTMSHRLKATDVLKKAG